MEKNRFIITRIFLLILTSTLLAACSSRPCREPRLPELDKTKTAASVSDEVDSASVTAIGTSPNAAGESASDGTVRRVRVYKPDGSRQCERRAGISLEVMERELAGIIVHTREKRKDGLMHIQVCGGPTGMINLYEIDAAMTKQAEQRGFKRLED